MLSNRHRLFLMVVILLLLLKGFININVGAPHAWLACDYGFRIVVLGLLAVAVRFTLFEWRDLGFSQICPKRLFLHTFGLSALILPISILLKPILFTCLPYLPPLSSYPLDPKSSLYTFDLIIGLPLVALSEEAIFRGFFLLNLFKFKRHKGISAVLLSTTIFALFHWSVSLPVVVHAFITGLILGWYTWRTRNIFPAIIVHNLINLVQFGLLWP